MGTGQIGLGKKWCGWDFGQISGHFLLTMERVCCIQLSKWTPAAGHLYGTTPKRTCNIQLDWMVIMYETR